MTAAPLLQQPRPLGDHALQVPELAGLAAIYDADIHLVVADHRPDPDAVAFVEQVCRQRLLTGLELVASPAQSFAAQLAEHAPAALRPMQAVAGFQAWGREIDQLIELFTLLFDLPAAGVRVKALNQPMCPRFHVDHVPCRLITTQGGVGTEWLAEEQVDRSLLARVDLPLATAVDPAAAVHPLAAWQIGLFRGEGWDDVDSPGGVVHRSPAVPAGAQRLLVTLDFPPGA